MNVVQFIHLSNHLAGQLWVPLCRQHHDKERCKLELAKTETYVGNYYCIRPSVECEYSPEPLRCEVCRGEELE